MPLFRGISVKIHTPFALNGLPETPLPVLNNLSYTVEEENKFASVFVPGHPQSLFWLSYSTEAADDETFFIFKLFFNGRHIVTWSCEEEQDWRGQVQFTLLHRSEGCSVQGGAGMEKRVLQFGEISPDKDEERCVEVRVLRACAKHRVPRQWEESQAFVVDSGIWLLEAGQTKRGHPRKFYSFKLIDPKDDPYVTFRFYYRTKGESGY